MSTAISSTIPTASSQASYLDGLTKLQNESNTDTLAMMTTQQTLQRNDQLTQATASLDK